MTCWGPHRWMYDRLAEPTTCSRCGVAYAKFRYPHERVIHRSDCRPSDTSEGPDPSIRYVRGTLPVDPGRRP